MSKSLVVIISVIILVAGGFLMVNNQTRQPNYPETPSLTSTTSSPIDTFSPTTIDSTTNPQTENPVMTEGQGLMSVIDGQSSSGESGNVWIEEKNGNVVVTIKIANAPATPQPAHFHTGTCDRLGGIKYSLNDVVNGLSTTTLAVTLKQLQADTPLAVNIHKSTDEMNTYVACGNLHIAE